MGKRTSYEKEMEKLADLEFEYNIARIYSKDEDIIKMAYLKLRDQEIKVFMMKKGGEK